MVQKSLDACSKENSSSAGRDEKLTIKFIWPNDYLTFQCIIDCWSARLDTGLPGAILSCDVVATHGFSSLNCFIKKLTNK